MRQFWVASCGTLGAKPAEFYSGARKIIRNVSLTYKVDKDFPSLRIGDSGYTKSKLTMLRKYYYVEESVDAAKQLWLKRCEQAKYGSVGFSTFGHIIKQHGLRHPWELAASRTGNEPREGGTMGGRRSKGEKPPEQKVSRTSIMGPCILAVTLTWAKKRTTVDVMYRTSELYKKWPADLVFLRDDLLSQFDFSSAPLHDIRFHFANATMHPMYWITIVPFLSNPVDLLKLLQRQDPYYANWVKKWTARYLCPEHHRGIEKFAQALRVGHTAERMIEPKTLRAVRDYVRKHHPGFRDDIEEEDDE